MGDLLTTVTSFIQEQGFTQHGWPEPPLNSGGRTAVWSVIWWHFWKALLNRNEMCVCRPTEGWGFRPCPRNVYQLNIWGVGLEVLLHVKSFLAHSEIGLSLPTLETIHLENIDSVVGPVLTLWWIVETLKFCCRVLCGCIWWIPPPQFVCRNWFSLVEPIQEKKFPFSLFMRRNCGHSHYFMVLVTIESNLCSQKMLTEGSCEKTARIRPSWARDAARTLVSTRYEVFLYLRSYLCYTPVPRVSLIIFKWKKPKLQNVADNYSLWVFLLNLSSKFYFCLSLLTRHKGDNFPTYMIWTTFLV